MAKSSRKPKRQAVHKKLIKKAGKRLVNSVNHISIQQKSQKIPGDVACLKIAGALYVILGLVSVFSGLLMIYLSYYSVGFITAFSSVLMQADIAIFMIGISSVSIGITEFIVGYGLWKLHKWAGMLGLILAGFSFLLGIPYLMLNQFSGALTLGFAVVLLFLIYIGNKRLAGDWL